MRKITALIRRSEIADEVKKVLIPRGHDATNSSWTPKYLSEEHAVLLRPLAVPKRYVTQNV
jgi:hypothetical protein